MSNFWKTVTCFIFAVFLSTTARADLDLFSRMYLSNKKYAKNITVQTYLVARDQLTGYFNAKTPPTIQQLKNGDLDKEDSDLFLIVECKNIGESYTFGELKVRLQGVNGEIPVYCHSVFGNMKTFVNCAVIHVGSLAVYPDDNAIPIITYRWEHLYTL